MSAPPTSSTWYPASRRAGGPGCATRWSPTAPSTGCTSCTRRSWRGSAGWRSARGTVGGSVRGGADRDRGRLTGPATVTGQVFEYGSRASGPPTVQAQELYRSLSDADATAASAFLSNGVEPAPLRQRYQDDIAAASAALAAVTAGTGTDRARVGRIAAQLPVYTGLVDTARTYNRLGIPLGAAYLREASGLMRADLLPAAQELYKQESDRLAGDLSGGAGFPWLAVPLLLITIAALVLAARYLTRRTQRLLNIGLVVATGAALLMLAWTTVSWLSVQGHLSRAQRAGADVVDELASARIAALNARADEALTLVARGSGGEFDKDFGDKMNQLGGRLGAARADAPGATGTAALTDVGKAMNAAGQAVADAQEHAKTWRDAHTKVRDQDNAGNDLEARAAADGFTLAVPGLVALTLLLLTGMVAGLQQRIAEYR